MKTKFLTLAIFTFLSISVSAQTKKDGTPDMRYKMNKMTYGSSYSIPSYSTPNYSIGRSYSIPGYSSPQTQRNYSNGGQYYIQNGYQRTNGTFVAPHIKTRADNKTYNNIIPPKNK